MLPRLGVYNEYGSDYEGIIGVSIENSTGFGA